MLQELSQYKGYVKYKPQTVMIELRRHALDQNYKISYNVMSCLPKHDISYIANRSECYANMQMKCIICRPILEISSLLKLMACFNS